MQRRSFLLTLGSLALGSGLTSCQNREQSILRLLALKSSLPPQLLGEFSKSIESNNSKVELASEAQFKEILAQLQEWYKTGKAEAKGFKIPFVPPAKSPEFIPNLVSLGDAWLPTAIQSKTIQPIDVKEIANWSKLESRWQNLTRRDELGNRSSTGQIWGVPYRWGTTVIMYRRDKFADANIPIPKDWADLWNPKLRQRISVLDRSREVIGLTLKKLGYSYNQADLTQVTNLKSELAKLHQQVKFYSSDYYLQPLIMGDTWAAVAWSSDAIDLVQKNQDIEAIVPPSGTALWADLWVQPTHKISSPDRQKLTQQWIDYSLKLQTSNQISIFTTGAAPLLTGIDRRKIMADIQNNPISLPPKTTLDKSDFIDALAPNAQAQFDRLWQEIRQVKVLA
jgi:putative spermidine/putrescine transport system substrate-binding protein